MHGGCNSLVPCWRRWRARASRAMQVLHVLARIVPSNGRSLFLNRSIGQIRSIMCSHNRDRVTFRRHINDRRTSIRHSSATRRVVSALSRAHPVVGTEAIKTTQAHRPASRAGTTVRRSRALAKRGRKQVLANRALEMAAAVSLVRACNRARQPSTRWCRRAKTAGHRAHRRPVRHKSRPTPS